MQSYFQILSLNGLSCLSNNTIILTNKIKSHVLSNFLFEELAKMELCPHSLASFLNNEFLMLLNLNEYIQSVKKDINSANEYNIHFKIQLFGNSALPTTWIAVLSTNEPADFIHSLIEAKIMPDVEPLFAEEVTPLIQHPEKIVYELNHESILDNLNYSSNEIHHFFNILISQLKQNHPFIAAFKSNYALNQLPKDLFANTSNSIKREQADLCLKMFCDCIALSNEQQEERLKVMEKYKENGLLISYQTIELLLNAFFKAENQADIFLNALTLSKF